MEDFIAGFKETADRYSSAADWISQHLAAMPCVDQGGQPIGALTILAGRPVQQERLRDLLAVG